VSSSSQPDAATDVPEISVTVARYLEAIFYIDAEGEDVRASRLAHWLGVSQPTAGATLQRIHRAGLIEMGDQRTIALTSEGRGVASAIVRRHRIAERWLTDYVGLDWAAADEEASRLEHALSDRVADRLLQLINNPTTCPHGNPIPGVDAPAHAERPLSRLAPGETARVLRISEVAEHEAPDLLRFLDVHGFKLGGRVRVTGRSVPGGTISVRVGANFTTLSLEMAEKVRVSV